jgi:murein DD-endopeptidase MepM/ murein hydrolase activator NlpD
MMLLLRTITATFVSISILASTTGSALAYPEQHPAVRTQVKALQTLYIPTLMHKPQEYSTQAYWNGAKRVQNRLKYAQREQRSNIRKLRKAWHTRDADPSCTKKRITTACSSIRVHSLQMLQALLSDVREQYLEERKVMIDAYVPIASHTASLRTLMTDGLWDRTYESITFEQIFDGHNEAIYALSTLKAPMTDTMTWPVHGTITAPFRSASYEEKFSAVHIGVDIATPQGTNVLSMMDGIVIYVQEATDNRYSFMAIAHRDGWTSVYGHLNDTIPKEGELVRAGDIIGKSGGTPQSNGAGTRTTGPHLHLELMQWGVRIDPIEFLTSRTARLASEEELHHTTL